jgi:hypothetical protein
MVYAQAGGVTGFDRGEKALEIAKCLISDSWLVDNRDGVLRPISSSEHWLVAIRRALDPATMIRSPDSTLLSDAKAHADYSRALRNSLMLQRYGKASETPTPPPIAKFFETMNQWNTGTMRYALDHSQGILVWRFGGGEYGLHCRGLSLDPTAWTTCVKRCVETAQDSLVPVATLNDMPAW